jgi:hypothetical protein
MTRMQQLLPERRQRNARSNCGVFMQREGLLHVLWMSGAAHDEMPEYHVGFIDYQGGDVKMRMIRGEEQLRSFLGLELGVPFQAIESAFEKLKRESVANIVNVVLPDDNLARLGLL